MEAKQQRPIATFMTSGPIVACMALVVIALFVGTAGLWPWDHDEVQSLMELGRVPLDRYPGPMVQMERMHRLVPVWHLLQNGALRVLPLNEWGTRILPSTCGALVVILSFVGALRQRGAWFGWSLLILMGGSQTLIWLSQQDRFYPLALLWMIAVVGWIWASSPSWRYDVLVAVSAAASVLTHNLTLVFFALGAVTAVGLLLVGRMPRVAVRRAVVAGATAAALYVFYLRPLVAGWVSGNTGGTQPLVSFVAQIGIVPIALALLGGVVALKDRDDSHLLWWAGLAIVGALFVATAGRTIGNWNPRYGLFFMLPVWVLAAAGSAAIAQALAPRRVATAWLLTLCVLLLPKFASHFIDGSRHDFRTSAAFIAAHAPAAQVVSNWAGTLQYYLQPLSGQQAKYWFPGQPLPESETVIAIASNAWEPVLRISGRSITVMAEIGRRRFDEQSQLIRVYLVSPAEARASPN